ncbi:hypothetical protein AOQ84DRAFT_307415 [Glonium stellatum]|uniref:Uncharacterized protein n=1 Tax=Glonium stellatum TaxID=574774 RepID=A0A8E2FDR4_9PEZI|nr:hypothetical protein AOQ84DRAFT_307415 [Glonium stellatum]
MGNMRNALISILVLLITVASATPNLFAPFLEAQLEETLTEGNDTAPRNELVKRQSNGCVSGYDSCANLGAAGLCCRSDSVCSADAAGHVACCPLNAACTGTIGGGVGATPTTTSSIPFVLAGTTTTSASFYFGTATATVASIQGATSAATYTRSTPLALQLIRAARLTSQAALRHSLEAFTALQSLAPTVALPFQQLQLQWIQRLPARFARA